MRGVRRKQVCCSPVVCGLGVGLVVSGPKGGAGYIDPHVATVGVDVWIYRSFSELKLSAPSSWGMFKGEHKCFDQGTVLLQGYPQRMRLQLRLYSFYPVLF